MKTEIITSAQNPKIKTLMELQEKSKARRREGLFVVEGVRELIHCIEAGYETFAIFACPDILSEDSLGEVLEAAEKSSARCICYSIPKALYEKVAYRGSTEGVIAELRCKSHNLEDLTVRENPVIVVLESVEKPGNLGTILRSADAAKVAAVIVCNRTTDIHNPNVVRASTGTMFSVPVAEASSDEALEFLKERGFKILAATPHAEKLHFEVDLTGNVAIALGAEQYGLTAKWMDGAELRVRIPMLGLADSLNVSAAATILVYEAVRQRIASRQVDVPAFEPWHGEGTKDF